MFVKDRLLSTIFDLSRSLVNSRGNKDVPVLNVTGVVYQSSVQGIDVGDEVNFEFSVDFECPDVVAFDGGAEPLPEASHSETSLFDPTFDD